MTLSLRSEIKNFNFNLHPKSRLYMVCVLSHLPAVLSCITGFCFHVFLCFAPTPTAYHNTGNVSRPLTFRGNIFYGDAPSSHPASGLSLLRRSALRVRFCVEFCLRGLRWCWWWLRAIVPFGLLDIQVDPNILLFLFFMIFFHHIIGPSLWFSCFRSLFCWFSVVDHTSL